MTHRQLPMTFKGLLDRDGCNALGKSVSFPSSFNLKIKLNDIATRLMKLHFMRMVQMISYVMNARHRNT